MPRAPRLPRGPGGRPIPWNTVLALGLRIAQEGRRRWDRLSRHEQQRLMALLRKSRGRLGMLHERERTELRRIVWKAIGPRG
jgi:hypothetical protein